MNFINESTFLKEQVRLIQEKIAASVAREDFSAAAELKKELVAMNEKIETLKLKGLQQQQQLPPAGEISKVAITESISRFKRFKAYKSDNVASSLNVISRIVAFAANAGAQYIAIRLAEKGGGLHVYVNRSTTPNCDAKSDNVQMYWIGKEAADALRATQAAKEAFVRQWESRQDHGNQQPIYTPTLDQYNAARKPNVIVWASYPANFESAILARKYSRFYGLKVEYDSVLHEHKRIMNSGLPHPPPETTETGRNLINAIADIDAHIDFQLSDHSNFNAQFDNLNDIDAIIDIFKSVKGKAVLFHELQWRKYTVGENKDWPLVLELFEDCRTASVAKKWGDVVSIEPHESAPYTKPPDEAKERHGMSVFNDRILSMFFRQVLPELNIKLNFDEIQWHMPHFDDMSFSLAGTRPKFSDKVGPSSDYVSRPLIEKEVLDVFEKTYLKSGTYFVMYGPKGAGKSSLVARVLGDKTGVAKISISQGDTTSSILAKICKMCGQTKSESADIDDFTAVFRDACEQRGGHPVTVVFEVERGSSSPEVLSLVKHVAKSFALNANVLIVLSEANAVLDFGDDQRQEFIWVNEMSRAEAEEFVKRRVPSISTEDFNRFVDSIGTLPLSLTMLCDALLAGQKVEDFIRTALASAKLDLVAFLHQPILAALKKAPDGVSIESFSGVKHEGVLLCEPKLVAPAMKLRNTIIFDFETGQYKLFSKAHQTALKTYNLPKID